MLKTIEFVEYIHIQRERERESKHAVALGFTRSSAYTVLLVRFCSLCFSVCIHKTLDIVEDTQRESV